MSSVTTFSGSGPVNSSIAATMAARVVRHDAFPASSAMTGLPSNVTQLSAPDSAGHFDRMAFISFLFRSHSAEVIKSVPYIFTQANSPTAVGPSVGVLLGLCDGMRVGAAVGDVVG